MRHGIVCALFLIISNACFGQTICKNGDCQFANGVTLTPLQENVFIDSNSVEAATESTDEDRLNRIIRATVRVTVGGICGSGTVVGRDGAGNAIVLTNAHVAGTQRGRIVQLERWNQDGTSERGQGAIIASGYGRGMSVDFALLKCNTDFAKDVVPIPLADRFPNGDVGVTTYGCPRCEWPSMQVLKLNRKEGQVLTWKPEAIGGRSGSSVVDYTEAGPRVVGLLTWGGGGEGLGQSTPFLLQAMRGRLPQTLEGLPPGVREVPCTDTTEADNFDGQKVPTVEPAQDDIVDSITEEGLKDRLKPKPPIDNGKPIVEPDRKPIQKIGEWFRSVTLTLLLAFASFSVGFFAGRMSK